MRILILLIASLLTTGLGTQTVQAQTVKVGYIDVELVMAYMPELDDIEKKLTFLNDSLSKRLKTQEDYIRVKEEEFMNARKKGTMDPTTEKAKLAEIEKLYNDLETNVEKSEEFLQTARVTLMTPVRDKLQQAIEELSTAEGYRYVFNTHLAGSSSILHGPEDHNLTKKLFAKLGIDFPQE
jgi:outer membrane protein